MKRIEELHKRGKSFVKAGHLAKAVNLYESITSDAPSDAKAWEALGTLRLQIGRHEEACEALERAASLVPDRAALFGNLGLARQRAGDLDGAESAYEKALRIDTRNLSATINLGTLHYERGEWEDAANQYRRALEIQPEHPDALVNLAFAERELGHVTEAEQIARKALAARPGWHLAQRALGDCLRDRGKLPEAESAYRQAAETTAAGWQPWYNLGGVLRLQGKDKAAMDAYRQVLETGKEVPQSVLAVIRSYIHREAPRQRMPLSQENLERQTEATRLQESGSIAEAVELYDRILDEEPECLISLHLKGIALCRNGDTSRGLELIEQTMNLDPLNAEFAFNLGNALRRIGRSADARHAFEKAILLRPDYVEAMVNLAAVLHRERGFQRAAVLLKQALSIRKGYTKAQRLLAQVLIEDQKHTEAETYAKALAAEGIAHGYGLCGLIAEMRGDYEQAQALYTSASGLDRDDMRHRLSLANLHYENHRFVQARQIYDEIIEAEPENELALYAKGLSYLIEGNYGEGWLYFEYRWREEGNPKPQIAKPRWRGENIEGRRLLVHAEQGLGDTILMMRYIPALNGRAKEVLVNAQNKMKPILQTSLGKCTIHEYRTPPSEDSYDLYIPMMSLPEALGGLPKDSWPGTPYITADQQLVERWEKRLPAKEGRRRVALFWQGNPNYPQDRRRSVPLQDLERIVLRDDLQLISLQKYHGRDQLLHAKAGGRILDLGGDIDNGGAAFLDTAAVLKNVDLFISSDSAAAHLAGAMGVRTWLMLPYTPDWRWGIDGCTTPWYPSMRLFRQTSPGDWPGVVESIYTALDG